MTNRRIGKWLTRGALLLIALVVLALVIAWLLLRGSLPTLDGSTALAELSAPVALQRDASGVVTVDAANEVDAMRALGYVHAQERYFEMDLMRRSAAGELAALFGPIAVDVDKRHRVHRLRARVRQALEQDDVFGDNRAIAEAYVAGVNAGLADLRVRPWPYLLLRTTPEPWRLEDMALVGHAMYFDLQGGDNAHELALWRLKPHLPAAAFELLTRDGTEWDAPLVGAARGAAMLPDATVLDLRKPAGPKYPAGKTVHGDVEHPGSNNFAVAGSLTEHGAAIVANDAHLGLRAPNIWFRARLRYSDPRAPGGQVDVSGFSLPGLAGIVVGSNRHVAWGFTNGYGDWMDWKLVPACAKPGQAAGVPADCPRITTHEERIEVAGAPAQLLKVEETAWGPIMHRDADGSGLALRWVAHQPGALNLGLTEFARAASVDELLALADDTAMPAQNLVLGDSAGHIAWREIGPIPLRSPDCPASPRSKVRDAGEMHPGTLADTAACVPWLVDTAAGPVVRDPESGRLWTANNRVVDGAALTRIGDGGYALGARARQVRDGLFSRTRFDEADLLAIQLDDRAIFLQRWHGLLQEQARVSADSTPALQRLARAAPQWDAHASVDAVSYRLVRGWRNEVLQRISDGLVEPANGKLGKDFDMPAPLQLEGVAWPLVTRQPAHLLPATFDSWAGLLDDAAAKVEADLAELGPLRERNWGERNTARICHPLAAALPGFMKSSLCMPFEPLPGGSDMPRIQAPDFGASERMVVAPGHEEDGIIHMPGGQSGHPLSPFWGSGHDAWVKGTPTPFLPGPIRHTVELRPGG